MVGTMVFNEEFCGVKSLREKLPATTTALGPFSESKNFCVKFPCHSVHNAALRARLMLFNNIYNNIFTCPDFFVRVHVLYQTIYTYECT